MKWNKGYYKILLDKDLDKYIRKNLSPDLKKAFDKKLKFLKEDCRYPSLNFKPYNISDKAKNQLGVSDIYEFYINMSFRCLVYVLDDKQELILFFIGNHEEVKRKIDGIK